jgi:putative ABC transport system substrate-binding protein
VTAERRVFLLALFGGAVTPAVFVGGAMAQPGLIRIGVLSGTDRNDGLLTPGFMRGLADVGYPEGRRGVAIEFRSTRGASELWPKMARELVELGCDVVFAVGPEHAVRAFLDLPSTPPVVFYAVDYDPVAKGIVQSLRQPGGNVTGLYVPVFEIVLKRLELAQEVLPGAKRFLVVSDVYAREQLDALQKAADARGVQLTTVEFARQPYDLAAAFEAGRRAKVDGLLGLSSPAFGARRADFATLFVKHRMPAFVSALSFSEPGFLVGLSADLSKAGRKTAAIGARILKGAKPADIPIEQADEFDLVVNLQTAKALGVKIPYSVLVRATRVIE